MNRWLWNMRMGAVALLFAGLVADCGGGGGGGGGGGNGGGIVMRRFFGMNGDGSCSNVVVSMNLDGAGAVLAHDHDDVIDCVIDPGLAGDGCTAKFEELGDILRATITGCTIPASTNLFSCGFEELDLSVLDTEVTAQCKCSVAGCDQTPPLCIDEDPDPASCEDCDNRIDDDHNGHKDCDDPNCEHSPLCDDPPVTSTSTSTTLPPDPLEIGFSLTSASGRVGAVQFTVNYASAPGGFDGSGEAVDCTSKVPGALIAANDKDSTRRLLLSLITLAGVEAPAPLITCRFSPGTPVPVPHNFTVVVADAASTSGNPITVRIGVSVVEQP